MKHYSQYLRGEILMCFTLLNKFISSPVVKTKKRKQIFYKFVKT